MGTMQTATALPQDGTALPKLYINGRFLVQDVTGVQRVAFEVAHQIDSMVADGSLRAEVILLVPQGSWVQDFEPRALTVQTVGWLRGILWEQLELPRAAADGTLLCLGNMAPVASLMRRPDRVGLMIHDVSFLYHRRAYRLGYRMLHRSLLPILLRRGRHVFTVSETEKERLAAFAPYVEPWLVAVPNGGWSEPDEGETVDPPSPAPDLPPPGFALYVGSFSHRKNFGNLLASAIRLAREDGLDFVFVGTAGKVLRRPACDIPADVAHRLHFLGQVNDRAQLARIYSAAGVLVFPSLYEACPLPPVEAAHFGCPTVASNIPSVWERCGTGVEYCDPLSVNSIMAATRRVLSDPRARERAATSEPMRSAGNGWRRQAEQVCRRLLPLAFHKQGDTDRAETVAAAQAWLTDGRRLAAGNTR